MERATFGMMELMVILLIVVVLFGANRLPQIGDALGRSVKNFKRAFSAADELDVTPKKELGGSKAEPIDVDAKVETKHT